MISEIWTKRYAGLAVVLIVGAVMLSACNERGPERGSGPGNMMSTAGGDTSQGKALFDAKCAMCHGVGGRGTQMGPPLVHKIYEPSHHGDMSFQMAVQRGVRQHHWPFGDMPPVPGLSTEDVSHIIAYVRQEQRRGGIN